jgi:patatin-like phospholipase/acyl hydrolase
MVNTVSENTKPVSKKILSLDGGGIRGVFTLVILEEIENRLGKPLAKVFDFMAGTSTGAIIALSLNVKNSLNGDTPKYSVREVLDLYLKSGTIIFPKKDWHKIKMLTYLRDEKYQSDGLETVLKQVMDQTPLSQSLTDLLITSYDIEARRPFFFKHFREKSHLGMLDAQMWEAARASSAAPTYFEPYLFMYNNNSEYKALIDGGVFANNPSLCAYSEALSVYGNQTNLTLISIGTGNYQKPYPYLVMKDLPAYKWAKPLSEIMMFGGVEVVDYQLKQLLEEGVNYFRITTELFGKRADYVDDASNSHLKSLIQAARKTISENKTVLDSLCNLIC